MTHGYTRPKWLKVWSMTRRAIPLLAALVVATASAFVFEAGSARAAPKPAAKPAKVEAPVTVESLLAQAQAATAKGETELALRLAQSAIVADPARPTSYVALGDIYAEAGQPDYARNFYDQALGIDPAQPGALKGISALDNAKPATTANAAQ